MDAKIISTSIGGAPLSTQPRPQNSRQTDVDPDVALKIGGEIAATAKTEETRPAESLQAQTAEEIDQLVDRLNTQSLTSSHTLRFSIDEKLGKAIISVVDRETDEVIRQIPPETALQIAEAFEEVTSGHLLTESA